LRTCLLALVSVALAACAATPDPGEEFPPALTIVPAGPFLMGSVRVERDMAYDLDLAAFGDARTRINRWYDAELARRAVDLPAYEIMRTPVSGNQYARFLEATGHSWPQMDEATWASYGLSSDYDTAEDYVWDDTDPPGGLDRHPVVLVSLEDARAFARWLSSVTGAAWRLPTEAEWEKAARGVTGQAYPWGAEFDASRLNSADAGPGESMAVGSMPSGASPYGALDMAGQVYEWTATAAGRGQHIVKGGSWDDRGCGLCRPAARHGRPADMRHFLIGFRLVREVPKGAF
jgi:formylglycine-generating enzyme required for sulfatase activity